MGHGRAGDELESFLRPKRYAAGFPTTHTLHHPSKTMKEQEALVRIPNLILVRVQDETNNPGPCTDTPHPVLVRSQPWQAGFQASHHPGHV